MEEVGISFLDQVTEDIVVDWEWTLVGNEWEFELNFFFSLLSKSCFTLSCELDPVIQDCGIDLNLPSSFDTVFQDGTSSLGYFWEGCAKWYKKFREACLYLRLLCN